MDGLPSGGTWFLEYKLDGHEFKTGDMTPTTTSGWQSPPDMRSPRGRTSSAASQVFSPRHFEPVDPLTLLPRTEVQGLPAASLAARRAVYAAVAVHLLQKAQSLPILEAAATKIEEDLPRRGGFFEWLFSGWTAASQKGGIGAAPEAASPSSALNSCQHSENSLREARAEPVKELSYSVRRAVYAAAARLPHRETKDTPTERGFFAWLFGPVNASESVYGHSSIETFNEESEDGNELGYRLEDLQEVGVLGHGSFGAVFLARSCSRGPSLAVKVISKALLAQRELQHTLVNERSVLRSSSSPFVVQLQAAFETSQFCYFLLEAALGGNLCTIYEIHGLFGSEVHAQFYVACVANAFEHLHEHGWTYRDLKTENVVLDARGYGKLCDFGTAKYLSGSQHQLTYTVCGTLEYMAPEIFHGRGYSFPADWWSLGIFAYELLVGETPFGAEEDSEVFAKMRKGMDKVRFPSTSSSWPDLVKSLCKDEPTDRVPILEDGGASIREQAWFSETRFDWDALKQCLLVPPHIPDVTGPEDLSNFTDEEQLFGNLSQDGMFCTRLSASTIRRDTQGWRTCLL
mmetsp:Transcript_67630/g.197944  ORF Transcript_67630/g.197944 Transcript_67630/m.197944 type:complete len:573 (-) Transcript_67630:248-1966(-)